MDTVVPVAAIKKGTVIDHIQAGQALKLIRLLHLTDHETQVTVGLNLKSVSLKRKDVIKVRGRHLTKEESQQIAIFSPEATVNLIDDYQVSKKFIVCLPEYVKGIFLCPNSQCITRFEQLESQFRVIEENPSINLSCFYCEKVYPEEAVKEYHPDYNSDYQTSLKI